MLRKETRVLGIDDGPFSKKDKNVLVVGVLFRGGEFLDGVLSTKIKVDGKNSTDKLTKMINTSKFKINLKAILLDGIALGGFNVIDIYKLNKKTKVPVIVVMRTYPNYEKIYSALDKAKLKFQKRLIEKLDKPAKVGKIFIQTAGLTFEDAKQLVNLTTKHAFIPEPLRVAHLIASGIIKGESKGRA
ncbi:DUF99 family protein [archaeon]|nr:DUF99 family protein [archaeon]